jgi:hypothetical protein
VIVVPAAMIFSLWLLGTRSFTQAWMLLVLVGMGLVLQRVSWRAAPPATASTV